MHLSLDLNLNGVLHRADLSQPTSLALPLHPNGPNPSCYHAEPPQSEVIQIGDFIGSVRQGGSVNYQRLHLTPHGNGTHTECVGHITAEPIYLPDCLREVFFPVQLISVQPEIQGDDQVITQAQLAAQLSEATLPGLVVRTLPNTAAKATRAYSNRNPPYFEADSGAYLAAKGVRHLLTDLPSVDREEDGGALRVHRGFWQYPESVRLSASITELIFVPDFLDDGFYLLNLQVPRILLDAVPSQPVVFPLQRVEEKTGKLSENK